MCRPSSVLHHCRRSKMCINTFSCPKVDVRDVLEVPDKGRWVFTVQMLLSNPNRRPDERTKNARNDTESWRW